MLILWLIWVCVFVFLLFRLFIYFNTIFAFCGIKEIENFVENIKNNEIFVLQFDIYLLVVLEM